jgi:hypothetical protein
MLVAGGLFLPQKMGQIDTTAEEMGQNITPSFLLNKD